VESSFDDIPPIYKDEKNQVMLYQGNALDILCRIPSGIVDLIFADPPYFLSNGGITCQSGKMVSVNKGKWDTGKNIQQVHEFNLKWLSECRRILQPNGSIFVSGTSHNIYSVGYAMQYLGMKILNDIIWYKINPPPNLSCRYFVHSTETIIWAKPSADSRHTFNYEKMRAIGDPVKGKQMHSLWRIPPPKQWEKRYGKHPTQKPEALLERVILAASNKGDLVLDPFSGSGTTGVVALRLGRRFIGIELEPSYNEIAIRRLQDETNSTQTKLAFSSTTDSLHNMENLE